MGNTSSVYPKTFPAVAPAMRYYHVPLAAPFPADVIDNKPPEAASDPFFVHVNLLWQMNGRPPGGWTPCASCRRVAV